MNAGQWVTHKTSECRLQKLKDNKKQGSKIDVSKPSAPVDVTSTETPAVPANSKVGNQSYASIAAGEMLPMRTKLKAMIDNANVINMASLYAAAMANQLSDGEDL